MERENAVTRRNIDELYSSDIDRDQIEGESGVSGNIIDDHHFWDIQGDKWKVKVVFLEV